MKKQTANLSTKNSAENSAENPAENLAVKTVDSAAVLLGDRSGGSAAIPRREKRAATRERLVQATIELLRQDGAAALNTVNITKRAGIAQSGFYLHFTNIDECKRAAAERVAEGIRRSVTKQRREIHKINSEDAQLLAAHLGKILDIFDTERKFAEIFLHNRHDRSPLGAVMRELYQQIHTDLAEDLQTVFFRRQKLSAAARERLFLQAEIIFAAALTTGEALLENRISQPELAAQLLAVNIISWIGAAFFQPDARLDLQLDVQPE